MSDAPSPATIAGWPVDRVAEMIPHMDAVAPGPFRVGVSDLPEPRRGDWMQTYTGRQFWPEDPRPEDIDIRDIAHALAMQCRYAGHTRVFYSVAQHSALVHDAALAQHPAHPHLWPWALLHDASEAYVTDVIRPLKHGALAAVKEVERRVMAVIMVRFALSGSIEPPSVKRLDDGILGDEARHLMVYPPPADWKLTAPPLGLAAIESWTPAEAEMQFLHRFDRLAAAGLVRP